MIAILLFSIGTVMGLGGFVFLWITPMGVECHSKDGRLKWKHKTEHKISYVAILLGAVLLVTSAALFANTITGK